MILYIAEKPSLGRAIADVLPKPHKREEGFIRVGNGDCVSWCIGHLLEQAEPDAYDSRYKKWQLDDLPIVPKKWQLVPKSQTRKQLAVLKKLLTQADQLVHAGDPDREGQLLVDQLIAYIGVKGDKRATIQRLLISDLNPAAVSRALTQLRDNRDFVPLSTSALARSRADWLYGINMTRAYTLQGQKAGYQGVLSVGRVQTPVLGLIVRRDEEIANFVAKPYFEVLAQLQTSADERFTARWQPSEACAPYRDEEGRVLCKKLAEKVVERIADKPARISKATRKNKTAAPPLPYNLSSLQIDAAKRYGMSAQQVLDICQKLYEQHKLITYPRSDCRFLPSEHYQQAKQVICAIESNCLPLKSACSQADPALKSKAWNDGKVEAHHAIIPTTKKCSGEHSLSQPEQQIYTLVARHYLCQFYPKKTYTEQQLDIIIAGGLFITKATRIVTPGWESLFKKPDTQQDVIADNHNPVLPALEKGDLLHCLHGELLEKLTQAPKAFTDATLLAAMTGISRYVRDPQIRKILRETDGLGTEATRAGIIELLFRRNFIYRTRQKSDDKKQSAGRGKQIHATEAGIALIRSLPEQASLPDMTAQWETGLSAISQRQSSYQHFMTPLETRLGELIAQCKSAVPTCLQGIKSSPGKSGKKPRKPSRRPTKKPARQAAAKP